mmetsp:Transcript_79610/g.225374  ORF Transcript_79610/g.225374 Transcript_79610/m.225374 type:complete len:205 (+) Transcript_79610:353-967(+)
MCQQSDGARHQELQARRPAVHPPDRGHRRGARRHPDSHLPSEARPAGLRVHRQAPRLRRRVLDVGVQQVHEAADRKGMLLGQLHPRKLGVPEEVRRHAVRDVAIPRPAAQDVPKRGRGARAVREDHVQPVGGEGQGPAWLRQLRVGNPADEHRRRRGAAHGLRGHGMAREPERPEDARVCGGRCLRWIHRVLLLLQSRLHPDGR